jgi:PAS domain S-box-containing protein
MMSSASLSLKKEFYQLLQSNPAIFDFVQTEGLDGVWFCDAQSAANAWIDVRFWDVLGYTYDEIQAFSQQPPRILSKDDLEMILLEITPNATKKYEKYETVLSYRHKNGTTVWSHCKGMVFFDTNGAPYRLLGTNNAPEQPKILAKNTITDDNLSRMLLDNLPAYVACRNYEGHFVFANKAFAALFGKKPEEIVGLTDQYYGATEEEINGYLANDRKVIETGEPLFIPEEVVMRADGQRGIFSVNKVPIQIEGLERRASLIIASDISVQKKAERQRLKQQKALTLQHKILTKISTTPFEQYGSLQKYLEMTTEALVEGLDVARASVWEYNSDAIHCKDLFLYKSSTHESGLSLFAKDFPIYFKGIETGLAIVAPNAHTHEYTCEFSEVYLTPLGINAMLDVPIRVDGGLKGVVCCECIVLDRKWTDDDVNFARSIADIISLAIEADRRRIAEVELKYTKEILAQTNLLAQLGGWEFNVQSKAFYISEVTKGIIELEDATNFTVEEMFTLFEDTSGCRQKIQAAQNDLIRTGRPFDLELQIKTIKGTHRWLRTMGQSIFEEGVCKRIFGSFQDITTQKEEMERNLRKQTAIEKQYKILSKISTTAFEQYASLEAYMKMVNQALCEGLGVVRASIWDYTGYSLVCKDLFEVGQMAELQDMELLAADFPVYFEGIESGLAIVAHDAHTHPHTYEFSKTHLTPFGVNSLLDVPIRIGGVLKGSICCEDNSGQRTWTDEDVNFARSIADVMSLAMEADRRRIAEAELEYTKEILAQTNLLARLGGWEYAVEKDLFYLSEVTKGIIELADDVPLDMQEVMIVFNENTGCRQKMQDAQRELLQNGIPFDLELQITTFKESKRWVRALGQSVFENGACKRIYGSFQDITEQKNFEIELIQTRERAQIASKAKSEFLANMSHEIRTPLNGVIGFTDLLMRTPLDKTQQQYMSTVLQSANSLLDIINDILDFSKIEAGKLELSVEQSDILELCNQVTDIITFQAHEKNLEILLNIAPNVPRFILADAFRLRQILVNLLGNAIKFTSKGEVELKIEVIESEQDTVSFRFSVRDTGVGIAKANQLKIFEAFSQEDASTTRKFGGTGLGLAISNRLLELMDSKLNVKSKINKGSTFFFEVKFKTIAGELVEWENIDKIQNVLIVDDNANNRLLLKEMLAFKKIASDQATNGIDALGMIAKKSYDVIIMDYHMPDMDGIETIRHIRERMMLSSEEMPVILLYSSSDDEYINASCKSLGVVHKMVKPVKIQQFFETLSHLKAVNTTISPIKTIGNSVVKAGATFAKNDNQTHILIVEDNSVNMFLLRTILEGAMPDAIITEAENGRIALTEVAEQTPDLVFMDIQMPELNGYQAAEAMRDLNHKFPIIALTAGTIVGERERCLDAGMNDYITKPVLKETIETMLQTWLPKPETDLKQHFNRQELEIRLNNQMRLVEKVIGMASTSIDEILDELEQNLADRDWKLLGANAHKIKGVALSISLGVLAKQSAELEHLEVFDAEKIAILLVEMRNEVQYLKLIVA